MSDDAATIFDEPENLEQEPELEPELEQEQASEQEAAEPESKEPQKEEEQKLVPLEALHESRAINRELRDQMAEMQTKFGKLEGLKEQLTEFRESQKTGSAEAQRLADEERFKDDPVGFMKDRTEKLEKELSGITKKQDLTEKQQEEANEQQQKFLALQRDIASQVDEFRQTVPDYQEAFKYLMEARVKEYQAMGIKDQNTIAQMFNQESLSLAAVAMQNKQNPGEVVYNLAKTRGYEKTDEKQDKAVEKQLDKLEKGQKASQTLSGGGVSPKGDLSLSEIDQMSDAEFDALWAEMGTSENHGDIFEG